MTTSFEQSATLSGYRELLRGFRARGYQSVSFHQICASAPHLILRHDVDLGLEPAVRVCEVDAEEGWRSTVFVLISSEFYNMASGAGRRLLRHLASMGHEIGLHFDPSAYDSLDWPDLEAAAARECSVLEDWLGAAVRVTALHRPSAIMPGFLGMPGPFAGRLHVYEPRYFSEITYISDGAGTWSHGHPLSMAAVAQRRGVQLLTHPYLWAGSTAAPQAAKIDSWLIQRARDLRREAVRNFRGYAARSTCPEAL